MTMQLEPLAGPVLATESARRLADAILSGESSRWSEAELEAALAAVEAEASTAGIGLEPDAA